MKVSTFFKVFLILAFLANFAGCTVIFQKGRTSDLLKIHELSDEIEKLSKAKETLEDKLKKEIDAKEVSLSMQDKGLVVTFLSEVLFDSGKATIKKSAYGSLDKVASVLLDGAAGMNVGIEGHTDNQPIKVSGWESNWELSGARAKSVLSYLIKKGIAPQRLSFIGYGEYRPVASNDNREGRQKNRRVEIVILPNITKAKASEEAKTEETKADTQLKEPVENLK
ncbi:MAG: OmpA family protein [Candidatus Omnitrophica bacterium]|nr:OmpA family protein [Candidatus Omnitrophota bacterium]MDD5351857.1 OmpA family protein [Candidatus Omnitrophota bacterium]MDD5550683.1 OmpA family protein [Candidatus Omnitrophota bacterium]